MEKHFKRTTITSALPYANGPVHIGHLAGVYVPADIYARYLRLKGRECLFIGGSDEHGVPVTIRARKEGITVQEVVDRYHNLIKDSFERFGISFDIYSRTTSPTHHKLASDFFRKLYDDGKFVEQVTEQFYDEQTGHFLTDRNIKGECPRCHAPEAYGDQCEKCGATLSPEELINPYNAETGNPLVRKATKHWYLPLDKDQAWLEKWILEEHKEWRSNVYGQCKSWLDGGLRPRAVTRDLDWGIPVPVEGAEGKVLYVWFDAPIGYISNTKELCDAHPELGSWEKWWKDPETRLVHFIGKDNIVFHCIVFPAMLKAHGDYILPDNVPSNEFLNLEGNKISTSKNYAVWLNEYLDELPGRQDELRYVLTANAPETKDNDFTWDDFQARCNNELVAVYGNFVNRALQLTQKYYEGRVPECGELTDYDRETLAEFKDVKERLEQLLEGASDMVRNYAPVDRRLAQLRAVEETSVGKHYTDLQGDDGKLSDLVDGRLALVDFYASWCGPCRAEIRDNLVPLWKKYQSKGLVIVGLNVWERGDRATREAAHQKVMADLGITYPQLVDSTRTATDTYGVRGIPQIMLIGPDGTILARDLRGAAIEEAVVKALGK